MLVTVPGGICQDWILPPPRAPEGSNLAWPGFLGFGCYFEISFHSKHLSLSRLLSPPTPLTLTILDVPLQQDLQPSSVSELQKPPNPTAPSSFKALAHVSLDLPTPCGVSFGITPFDGQENYGTRETWQVVSVVTWQELQHQDATSARALSLSWTYRSGLVVFHSSCLPLRKSTYKKQ